MRRLREARDLSQDAAGRLGGTHQATVSSIENPKSTKAHRATTIRGLLNAYGRVCPFSLHEMREIRTNLDIDPQSLPIDAIEDPASESEDLATLVEALRSKIGTRAATQLIRASIAAADVARHRADAPAASPSSTSA